MPPPAKPSAREEEYFMKNLLADLDDSFFDAVPSSPNPIPTQNITRHHATPTADALSSTPKKEARLTQRSKTPKRVPLAQLGLNTRVNQLAAPAQNNTKKSVGTKTVDNNALCEGAESWDWKEDMDGTGDISRDTTRPGTQATSNALGISRASPKVKLQSKNSVMRPGEKNDDIRASTVQQTMRKPVDVDDVDMDALLEGASDWDWTEMDVDGTTAGDATLSQTLSDFPKPPPLVREPCTRCVVEQISASGFSEKRLLVRVDGRSETEKREVILKQDWVHTDVAVGDLINVLGDFTPFSASSSSTSTPSFTITITSRCNTLVLHPDLLLSATTIANAPSCTRKPLISALLTSNAPSPPSSTDTGSIRTGIVQGQSEAVVWGNFLHEIMQRCMGTGQWGKSCIEESIEEVVRTPGGLGELIKLGIGIERARFEVRARAGGLEEFAKRFIGSTVKSDAQLTDAREMEGVTSRLALTTLHDVEEDIWSPTYGLKGKLDASVQVLIEKTKDVPTGKLSPSKPGQTDTQSWTMPFEIKTGRAVGVLEHRAQTMLYTLLIAERYGVEVPSGLLYYTQSKDLMCVPTARNELKGLIMARNELASYMMRKRVSKAESESSKPVGQTFLPPTIDDNYKCTKCYAVDGCMLYRKAVEGVVDESSAIAQVYDKKTSHLTLAQCEFFKKWEALITLEEQEAVRFRKELWTLNAEDRERMGRCFANMMVQSYKHDDSPGVAKIHQHLYRFVRTNTSNLTALSAATPLPSYESKSSLLNGSMSTGDAVTVSIEPDLLAIARGYVVELAPQHVVVGFDHEINLTGILKRTRSIDATLDMIVCRVDKDEFAGGMGRIRDNLARLFYTHGDTKRLSLVVDLAPPSFDEHLLPDTSELPANLNLNQQDAVRKVLSAKDYAIILGMPGTGKTATIAEIINVLVKRGKTVLLTSYTHSAVDTILLKLDNADYPILRLGSLDKVHPGVHKYTLAHQQPPTTIEQLEHQILRPPVVATTCLSVDHALFARRYFDFCIVDEASQVTLPTCLGPLRYADKFVLVGDHFQLPPLVRNRDARKGGLDVSLFRRLVDAHPEAVVDLVYQYRMNEDIMHLSNKLIYNDRLRCGSNSVAKCALVLPNMDALSSFHTDACLSGGCWMDKLLDGNCKAVFIDTDLVPGKESHMGDLVQNEVEARLVYHVTEALLLSGVDQRQIGVISLYRQQIKLLSHLLHHRKQIELLTADRSQGRDKDCIIISMVRSNAEGQVGTLIKDWRRINVSFTRARSKLIIFGSRKTLRTAPVLDEFFQLMENKGWILPLPPGSDTVHAPRTENKTGTPKTKRRATDVEDLEKENSNGSVQRKTKKVKTEQGVLKGRPLLQDVVNDM